MHAPKFLCSSRNRKVVLGWPYSFVPLYLRLSLSYFLGGKFLTLIHRGYYTVARRYEFYFLVERITLFLPRQHKIHILEPPCNVLVIIWRLNKRDAGKSKRRIVTSMNDTTLTKVTYGKCATRVPDEVAYGIYEWFSSQ